jgi:hypothetical protein
MTIEQRRTAIQTEQVAVTALTAKIKEIAKVLDLDEERVLKRIDNATSSEYGATNGLINLVASIANWPVEQGDGANVSTNRAILADKIGLNLVLLAEIKSLRGYHTFISDDLTKIAGVEPDYEAYQQYCQIFLEDILADATKSIDNIDEVLEQITGKLTSEKWTKAEAKAIRSADLEYQERLADIELHKAYIEAKQ